MAKTCFNIFARQCPACKSTVPWAKRKLLIKQERIQCVKCKARLVISPRDRMINTFLLISLICTLDAFLFEEPSQIRQCMMFLGAVVFEIPRLFNILFSLVEADKSKLKDYVS